MSAAELSAEDLARAADALFRYAADAVYPGSIEHRRLLWAASHLTTPEGHRDTWDWDALPDRVIADHLAGLWCYRYAADGSRETFDPVAGLWRSDSDLAATVRQRRERRRVLGSERDTHALNKYERNPEAE